MPEARIQQFVFPCPCDTVSPEIFNRTSWNCWAAGADFYIPREIIRKDSVNYTIEGLVTDFNDTLSFYSYVVRGEANIDTNSIYFQDRLFMGIIENMNVLGPGDEREYSLGFRIKDNNSGRTKDTLSVATINYLPEYSGYIAEKRFSKNAYPPLTAPGNELQRENTIIIWFPATGLNKITNDSGTAEIYSGTADIYALDRRLARKEGYWKISDIRFGNIGDTLSAPPVDTTQLKPADKYAPGFLGTYDIRINKGPNAIIKMPIDVSRLSEGIYDMQLNIYADSGGLKKQICQARIEAVFIK